MPHMRGGPDTWHVSQTRRCVESSLLSPFKPREPAERRVGHPSTTRAISTRRTCKIDTSPSPQEACWLLFSTCTILRIRLRGLRSGLRGFRSGLLGLRSGLRGLRSGLRGLRSGLRGLRSGLRGLRSGLCGLDIRGRGALHPPQSGSRAMRNFPPPLLTPLRPSTPATVST